MRILISMNLLAYVSVYLSVYSLSTIVLHFITSSTHLCIYQIDRYMEKYEEKQIDRLVDRHKD